MTPTRTTAAPRHRPASHAGRGLRRGPVPRAPRRVSGPAQPAFAGAPAAARPFALRLGATAMRVGDARLLDRLVRGRAWIALVAVGLMGIVFMQVSLLKLNAGISRAVTAADTLDRQNSTLRGEISNLDSGERIQSVAAKLGMITPAAGDVHYLDGRQADGARAATSIKPPNPVAATAAPAGVQQPAALQQPPAAAAQQQQQPAAVQQPAQTATTAATTQQPQQQTPAQPSAGTTTGGATTAPSTSTAPPAATAANPVAAAGGASAPQGG